MQSSIWGSWSRARPTVKGYALTVGIWALAAAAVIDGAQQPEPPADVAFLGSMTVTASRLDDSPLIADLGSMTVTASRLDAPLIADLGVDDGHGTA